MKYLLTGGAGFVGSNLTEALLHKGHIITCLDNLTTGTRENTKKFESNKNFNFVEGDVRNENLVGKLVSECDRVFHLAAAVGVQYVLEKPLETIQTNVKGTEIILEQCHKFNKRVMIFSTSEVYGKNSKLPFKEDDDRLMGTTLKMRWAYAASKALDEFLSIAYNREKNLDVIIVRLFNTVGIGQVSDYGMVIPRFVKQAISNKNITIYGDGKQTRCFCNVKDVIFGLSKLMDENEAIGQIYNIGTEERISILDLARLIIKMTGSKSKLIFIPLEEVLGDDFEDMLHRVPDTSKIESLINFKPSYNLEKTLREVIDFTLKNN